MPPKKTRAKAAAPSSEPADDECAFKLPDLSLLMQMPFDIAMEVFGWVDPGTLLNLARTTKTLRETLMTHAARPIWQLAFRCDEFAPPCPDDLSEPAYANLMFSQHCHFCMKHADSDAAILWAHRVRCCFICSSGRFSDIPFNATEDVRNLVLTSYHYGHQRCDSRDVRNIEFTLFDLKSSPQELEEYKRATLEHVTKIKTWAESCRRGAQEREIRKKQMEDQIRKQRQRQILARLKDLGYGEECDYLENKRSTSMDLNSVFKEPALLTEKVWKRLKPGLLQFMEEVRQERIKVERRGLFYKRYNLLLPIFREYRDQFSSADIIPSLADIFATPEIDAIMNNQDIKAFVTPESLEGIRAQLPKICENWRRSKDEYLKTLLPPNYPGLNNCTTWFSCAHCGEPIAYPRILNHRCLTKLRMGYRNRDDFEIKLLDALNAEPWNIDNNRVKFNHEAGRAAVAVVRSLGLDPQNTTMEHLEQLDPWVQCMSCSDVQRGDPVFRWKHAVLHDLAHKLARHGIAHWRHLQSLGIPSADDKETEALDASKYYSSHDAAMDMVCKKCNGKMSWPELKRHVKLCYKNPMKIAGRGDYHFAADAPVHCPGYIVIIPHYKQPPLYLDLTCESSENAQTSRKASKRKHESIDLTADASTDSIQILDAGPCASSNGVTNGDLQNSDNSEVEEVKESPPSRKRRKATTVRNGEPKDVVIIVDED